MENQTSKLKKYPKAAIYTRTGDLGQTRLVGGQSVSKSHIQVSSYGDLDELNSHIGFLRSLIQKKKDDSIIYIDLELSDIQSLLFNIGSYFASETKLIAANLIRIESIQIEALEGAIDRMTSNLPKLTQFILPAGGELASYTHVARSVCRRAERNCILVADFWKQNEQAPLPPQLEIQFLNRLSDYFFTLARFFQFMDGQPDVPWQKTMKQILQNDSLSD